MQSLTTNDLIPMAGEPRVRDVRLGEVLGFDRDRKVRDLISRHRGEILDYGPLPQVGAMVHIGSGAKREVAEYHLNESQALLVCLFARTEKAAAVRKQLIEIFLAYRRGELTASSDAGPVDRTIEVLNRLEARLAALESAGRRLNKLVSEPLETAMALGHAADVWFGQKRAARPKFWGDFEVRSLVLATYRQMTVDQARDYIRARCGEARTPSRGSLHRFWQRLDLLKAQVPSLRMH